MRFNILLIALFASVLVSYSGAFSCGISSYNGINFNGCKSINITNTQTSGTGLDFQLAITNFPTNALIGNYTFYDTATSKDLYSFAINPTLVLLNVSAGIGSDTSYNSIRVEYASPSSNLFASGNGYTGEAPQYSSTYGKYDNGNKVYSTYCNWDSALCSGWAVGGTGLTGSGTTTTSDGLKIASTSGAYGITFSPNLNPETTVVDCMCSVSNSSEVILTAQGVGYDVQGNPQYQLSPISASNGWFLENYNGAANHVQVTTSFNTSNSLLSLWITSSGSYGSSWFGTGTENTGGFTASTSEPLQMFVYYQAAPTAAFQSVFVGMRTQPPNNVMPSVSFYTPPVPPSPVNPLVNITAQPAFPNLTKGGMNLFNVTSIGSALSFTLLLPDFPYILILLAMGLIFVKTKNIPLSFAGGAFVGLLLTSIAPAISGFVVILAAVTALLFGVFIFIRRHRNTK